jgi:hypothetical protein
MQIDLTVMIFIVLTCLIFIITKQQRTIDRLTDKLIGVQHVPKSKVEPIKEDDSSPVKDDEPKTWYDH